IRSIHFRAGPNQELMQADFVYRCDQFGLSDSKRHIRRGLCLHLCRQDQLRSISQSASSSTWLYDNSSHSLHPAPCPYTDNVSVVPQLDRSSTETHSSHT